LVAAGFPVPSGLCLTTAAFSQFLEACSKRDQILSLLSKCSAATTKEIADWSSQVQACLGHTEVPAKIKAELVAAWRKLGEERSYAVRSSATVEDTPDRSFARQFESVLNVGGADALLHAVKTCWLSLFSARALTYLARQQIALDKVRMAVVVQEMVAADFSGVTFTADPLTGATDRLALTCANASGRARKSIK
jgi:pyruvate,water dikinase